MKTKTNNPAIYNRLALVAALAITGSASAAIIAGGNGSFETTTAGTAAGPWWGSYALNAVTINSWTVTNPDGSAWSGGNAPWFDNNNSGYGASSDGNFFVNVEGGVKWRLTAPITGLSMGQTYTVKFDTRIRSGGGAGDFDVSVNTTSPSGGFNIKPTTTTWTQQSFNFVAEATSHTLTISNQDTSGIGFMVDNFTVVPEPSATALGLLAAGGLLLRRRRS